MSNVLGNSAFLGGGSNGNSGLKIGTYTGNYANSDNNDPGQEITVGFKPSALFIQIAEYKQIETYNNKTVTNILAVPGNMPSSIKFTDTGFIVKNRKGTSSCMWSNINYNGYVYSYIAFA